MIQLIHKTSADFFWAKNQIPVLRHAPYSPNMAPSDFWLSPKIKRPKFGYEYFSHNENPTRVLNTTSPKCCLPSTDAIDRQEKIHACE